MLSGLTAPALRLYIVLSKEPAAQYGWAVSLCRVRDTLLAKQNSHYSLPRVRKAIEELVKREIATAEWEQTDHGKQLREIALVRRSKEIDDEV